MHFLPGTVNAVARSYSQLFSPSLLYYFQLYLWLQPLVQYFSLCKKVWDLLYLMLSFILFGVIVFKLGLSSRNFSFLNYKFMSPIIKPVFGFFRISVQIGSSALYSHSMK